MNADAVFVFTQSPAAHTRLIETLHTGADIADFPAIYKVGANKGKRYIGYRETVQKKPGHRQFTHCIELDRGRMVTGLNFTPEMPRRSFGDYGGHAVLVELSKTRDKIIMYFFLNEKEAAQTIFEKWNCGELSGMAALDAVRLTA
ncbi:MAG: hypothetical protein LBC51_03920 [Treponema sp.]|jgi:hypothetical protein|nr:hypothetical protein [Treponema sp.]